MTEGLLLGIDIGTFGSKGVLSTPAGAVVAEHRIEHGLSVPQPGWAEHDADQVWWGGLCLIVAALLDEAQVDGGDISAVAISALGADVVPLDAHGDPLRPAILYGIDTRSTGQIVELDARFGAEEMATLAGQYLTTQAIGPKIMWIRDNEPDVFRRTEYLCSASTYLVLRLTGEYVIDHHSAGIFNPLYDLEHGRWSDRFAEPIIGDKRLPRLGWVDEVAGHVAERAAAETGLHVGTPVTVGTIDAIADAVSVGVIEPGDLMLMYGTTSFLVLIQDHAVPANEVLWQVPYAFAGSYDIEAGMATTGAMTRWFRDHFTGSERAPYAELADEATRVPLGSDGLVVLPYFSGERTPINDPEARGMIAGLSLGHGRGHVYRAMLEATAYGVTHNLEAMRGAGAVARRVVAVGGGTQSDLQLQVVSDVAGIEQILPRQTIGASYGDAFLAGLATGQLSMADLHGSWVRTQRIIEPDPAASARYAEYLDVYKRLYLDSREELHRLAEFQRAAHLG
jgi:xylulokinase